MVAVVAKKALLKLINVLKVHVAFDTHLKIGLAFGLVSSFGPYVYKFIVQ
jgi:hypothetical protein